MIIVFREAEYIYVAHGTIGTWPVGSLHAIGGGDGTVSVENKSRTSADGTEFAEISGVAFGDFVDADGVAYGADETETVNALNALFTESALAVPTVTSATTVSVGTNTPVNYTVTGENIVGIEWGSIPAGLAPSLANRRVLTGEITIAGTYPVDVTVTNGFGTTTATISFVVVSTFADTKSVRFNNADFMQFDPPITATDRAGNGAGAGDAWSIACWFKGSLNTNTAQTIWSFGNAPLNTQGTAWLYWGGRNNNNVVFRYGSNTNRLQLQTDANTVLYDQWHHVMITYDGGTTGVSSGSLADYYSRFTILIDGVAVSTTNSNSNYGYSGNVNSLYSRLGRTTSGQYNKGSLINEVAIWGSDQSANVGAIYNGGAPHNLNALGTAPDHWHRMGDDDTFPTMADNSGGSDGTLYNMTSADIVSDAP